MNLFNNKFRINENGDFEADGHFHATKSIKVHDGFEILDPETEDVVFEVFISSLSTLSPLPEAFDNALVFRTKEIRNINNMQYSFWNYTLNRPILTLNQGAPGSVTMCDRSFVIGSQKGAKPLDDDYCDGTGDFPNLAFDTNQFGADLGVEHAIECPNIFTDQINESTPGTGVSINENFKVIDGEVYILNLAGQGNKPIQVDDDGRLYTLP